MPIYKEFKDRIDRTLDISVETARGATLNRAAWNKVVVELSAMKRLLEESALYAGDSLRRAEVARENSDTLETLTIEQAESAASAKTIGDNTGIFEFNDVGTVVAWLERIEPEVFGAAWARLSGERQATLRDE